MWLAKIPVLYEKEDYVIVDLDDYYISRELGKFIYIHHKTKFLTDIPTNDESTPVTFRLEDRYSCVSSIEELKIKLDMEGKHLSKIECSRLGLCSVFRSYLKKNWARYQLEKRF